MKNSETLSSGLGYFHDLAVDVLAQPVGERWESHDERRSEDGAHGEAKFAGCPGEKVAEKVEHVFHG